MIRRNMKRTFSFMKNRLLCTLVVGVIFISSYSAKGAIAELWFSAMLHGSSLDSIPHSTQKPDLCSTVHIAIACTGFQGPRILSTFVKSLIFHRTRPIHLHLITDGNSKMILTHLFYTWSIPHLQVSFYTIYEALGKIQHLHNSTDHAWWKLSVPQLLPLSVDRVITLEHNLVIDHDVSELWSYFNSMSATEAIAAVEEQSYKYFSKLNEKSYGFNSDVMLLNLTELRTDIWKGRWKNAINKLGNARASLNVDDVLNNVADKEPNVLHTLPCVWNVQLANGFADLCYYNVSKMKIINWNPISKKKSTRQEDHHLRYVETGFRSLDGNMIRDLVLHCGNSHQVGQAVTILNDSCQEIREAARIQFRTHLFYLDYQHGETKANDVTWVAHLSPDRLNMIELLCKYWKGPISLALYLSDREADKLVSFVRNSPILRKRQNIGYHVVFKQGDTYPINFLRNVALDNVRTPYAFLSDIDFLPMPNLRSVLVKHIRLAKASKNTALVVPAFETQKRDVQIPSTKSKLLRQLQRHTFHYFMQYTRPRSQSPTNFEKWKIAVKPYEVKWYRDFEPYLVVHRDVVRYDPRFVGYQYNRAAHTLEMKAQGYRFRVLPDAYILHLVHAKSEAASQYKNSIMTKKCLEIVENEFISDIKLRYPNSTIDV